jgi:Protein of unknown function (DUF2905)
MQMPGGLWCDGNEMSLGRVLIVTGVVLACAGLLLTLAEKANLPLGRLPGDIVFRGKHSTVYFPIVTCLLLSVLASIVMWLLNRR